MAEFLSLLSTTFFLAGAVLVAVLVLGVSFVLARSLRRRWRRARNSAPSRQVRQDFLNTRILFQTMRDVLEQQRDLARELNKSLNRKVAYIKETVDAAMADLKTLRESVRDLSQRLEDAKGELARVREHPSSSEGNADLPVARPVRGTARESGQPAASGVPSPSDHDRPSLQILARPAEPEPKTEVLDYWAGFDFAGDVLEPDGVAALDQPPEAPEDGEAARRAFRALLSIETDRPRSAGHLSEAVRGSGEPGGNGRVNALHARVYEYSDAGMTVPEIARELGIGKGEIRLILSLRKARG